MLRIEHGERVMRLGGARRGGRQKRGHCDRQSHSHASLLRPLLLPWLPDPTVRHGIPRHLARVPYRQEKDRLGGRKAAGTSFRHDPACAAFVARGRGAHYLRDDRPGVAASASWRSAPARTLGTKPSEKPARKHQNVSKARDFDGITKVIGTALGPGTSTNSILTSLKLGKSVPSAIPDRRKK